MNGVILSVAPVTLSCGSVQAALLHQLVLFCHAEEVKPSCGAKRE